MINVYGRVSADVYGSDRHADVRDYAHRDYAHDALRGYGYDHDRDDDRHENDYMDALAVKREHEYASLLILQRVDGLLNGSF